MSIIQFLWKSKIKSRAAFTTMLEFLDEKRTTLKPILILMKKNGGQFYDKYVENSWQYFMSDHRRSGELVIG